VRSTSVSVNRAIHRQPTTGPGPSSAARPSDLNRPDPLDKPSVVVKQMGGSNPGSRVTVDVSALRVVTQGLVDPRWRQLPVHERHLGVMPHVQYVGAFGDIRHSSYRAQSRRSVLAAPLTQISFGAPICLQQPGSLLSGARNPVSNKRLEHRSMHRLEQLPVEKPGDSLRAE
jgi:hypothetical protein